jgi:hypothetical protein
MSYPLSSRRWLTQYIEEEIDLIISLLIVSLKICHSYWELGRHHCWRKAANLDLLALMAFSSINLRAKPAATRDLRFKVISERLVILTVICIALTKEQ